MWRCALVLLVACGSSSAHSDAKETADQCQADLDGKLDRSCRMPSDCVLVESSDCCGPVELAVHAGTESSFPAAQASYEACLACPPSGCAHVPLDEDGQAPGAGQSIVATCLLDTCKSVIQ